MVIVLCNLIAHRGRNSSIFGENTKEGIFDSFNSSYVSGVEIDVRITKDNKIVVIHDMTINRTSDGYGFVNSPDSVFCAGCGIKMDEYKMPEDKPETDEGKEI